MSPCLGWGRGRAFKGVWHLCLTFEGQLVLGRRYLGRDNVQGGQGERHAQRCAQVWHNCFCCCAGVLTCFAHVSPVVGWWGGVWCASHALSVRERMNVGDRGQIAVDLVHHETEPAITLKRVFGTLTWKSDVIRFDWEKYPEALGIGIKIASEISGDSWNSLIEKQGRARVKAFVHCEQRELRN